MLVREFNPKTASEHELAAYHTFTNAIFHEFWPEDELPPLENTLAWLMHTPDLIDIKYWLVWDQPTQRVIARASVETWKTEENQHIAEFDINILPAYRGQGLGTRLLELVATEARQRGRRLLTSWVDQGSVSGTSFLTRLGAQPGLEMHTNQLDLATLDRELVQSWLERAPERAQGFVLETIEGRYPDDQIAAICDLFNVMNDAPRGTLEWEDEQVTAEREREWEASMLARGQQRWHMHIREVATGELAGFTVTAWNPYRPDIQQQWGTGVKPKFRNKGLGRWLKAAMLDKILRERPTVKRVRTGNADSNGPMLKINYELGFKPYKANAVWQVELDKVEQYLEERAELARVAA